MTLVVRFTTKQFSEFHTFFVCFASNHILPPTHGSIVESVRGVISTRVGELVDRGGDVLVFLPQEDRFCEVSPAF